MNVSPVTDDGGTERSFALADDQPRSASPLRVLVLDDCRFDRARLKRMAKLANLNLDITEADSLDGMQLALQSDVFDLYIIDYNLPADSGFGALRRLRQMRHFEQASVIMVTGLDAPEMAPVALHSGCDLFIQKDDLTPRNLQEAVFEAMAKRRARPVQIRSDEDGAARSSSACEARANEVALRSRPAGHGRKQQRMLKLAVHLMQQDDFIFHWGRFQVTPNNPLGSKGRSH